MSNPFSAPSAATTQALELMIVMPVFNEQASVRKVVREWFNEIESWTENFVYVVLDDGSNDGTPGLLARLREEMGERFEFHRHDNRGHGQTYLRGYCLAAERGATFVLQIDSDGQCDPQYFFRFWRRREEFDVIYGARHQRDDGWRRVVASII